MLLDIPADLALEIISVWLGRELKCLSSLDDAYCSTVHRPAFLDLISDDRGGESTVLDRFKPDDDDPLFYDLIPAMFVAYLLWLESRQVPIRTLTVAGSALRQVADAAFLPRLHTVGTVRCDQDFHWAEDGLGRLIQHCPNVTALSIAVDDDVKTRVIQILLAVHDDIAIRSLSFHRYSTVSDNGICMLVQRFGRTLIDLKLPSYAELSDQTAITLARFCKKLEVLELSCAKISMQALRNLLVSCKRLWSLTLHNFTGDDDSLLELLQVRLNKLEVIKVYISVEMAGHLAMRLFVRVLQAFPSASAVTINHCSYSTTMKCPSYGTAVINCHAAQKVLAQKHVHHEQAWAKVALWVEPTDIMDAFTSPRTDTTNKAILSLLDALPSDIQEFAFDGRRGLSPEHFKMLTTKFSISLRMVTCDKDQYDVMADNAVEVAQTCPNLSHVCGIHLSEALRRAGIERTVQRLGFECKECMEDV